MILSSKKAAEFLNVNESTVKRWADNGKLKSFKTPGGHRKFNFEDLKKISEEKGYVTDHLSAYADNANTFKEISDRKFESLSNKFGKYLLKGDTGTAFDLIYLLYLDKVPVAQIFDEVVKASMKTIGDKWEKGLLGIDDEHIASGALLSVIHRFENEITDKYYSGSRKRKTAVCTGLENELHDIGLHCVKITLKHMGWNVIFPGSNLPGDSVVKLLETKKPDLLCISFKANNINGGFKEVISEILKAARKHNIKIFSGGEPDTEPEDIVRFKDLVSFTKHLKKLK